MAKTHYDTLGVSHDATKDEIKSARNRLARIYHPDVYKETDATEKMQEINEAYETLFDDEARAKYDSITGSSRDRQGEKKFRTFTYAELEFIKNNLYSLLRSATSLDQLIYFIQSKLAEYPELIQHMPFIVEDLRKLENAKIHEIRDATIAVIAKSLSNSESSDQVRSQSSSRKEQKAKSTQGGSKAKTEQRQPPQEETPEEEAAREAKQREEWAQQAKERAEKDARAKAEREEKAEKQRIVDLVNDFERMVGSVKSYEGLRTTIKSFLRDDKDENELLTEVSGLREDIGYLDYIVAAYTVSDAPHRRFWEKANDITVKSKGLKGFQNEKIRNVAERIYADQMKEYLKPKVERGGSITPNETPFTSFEDLALFFEDLDEWVSIDESFTTEEGRYERRTLHGKDIAARVRQFEVLLNNPNFDWDFFISRGQNFDNLASHFHARMIGQSKKVEQLGFDKYVTLPIHFHLRTLIERKVKEVMEQRLIDSRTIEELLRYMSFFSDSEVDLILQNSLEKKEPVPSEKHHRLKLYPINIENGLVLGLTNWANLRVHKRLLRSSEEKSNAQKISLVREKTYITNPALLRLLVQILDRQYPAQ